MLVENLKRGSVNSRLNLGLQTSQKTSTAPVHCKSHSCFKTVEHLKICTAQTADGCGSTEQREAGVNSRRPEFLELKSLSFRLISG